METILCHYWIRSNEGNSTLYEAAYYSYRIREGVQCHAKVPCSERPCACREREVQERLSTAALNSSRTEPRGR
jgi:hypothetical protein